MLRLPDIPNGVYTATVTRRDVLRFAKRYSPPGGESPLQEAGPRVLRLFNGHWSGMRPRDTDSGIYYVSGRHLVFEWITADPGRKLYVDWKLKGTCLSFTVFKVDPTSRDFVAGDQYTWQVKPLCLKDEAARA
jgi:hypothetical protein